jgi:predicted deacylase
MITIGDLTASPGQKVSGNIPIHGQAPAEQQVDNATPTSIPVTIIHGMEDGPTLVVLSGIHGSEYIPILSSQRLAQNLNSGGDSAGERELTLQNGALILIHIANLPSFLGRTIYTSPVDHLNLNRQFPGTPDGTISQRIAYTLVHHVYPLADYVMDMHSGDGNEQLGPTYSGYYGKAGSDSVILASKDMAFAFGLDLVVEFQWEVQQQEHEDDPNDNGTSTTGAIWAGSAAVVRGIPSIDVEMAPGMGSTREESIEQAYQGVLRVLVHLQMLPETVLKEHHQHTHTPCLVKERYFIDSPFTGSWTPLIDTGTFVQKGTSLGYLTDLYGRTAIYEAEAPTDGLLLIRFESPPVLKNDTLAVIAVLNTSDPVCERLRQDGLSTNSNADIGADVLILWQWAAVTGWLAAFALGLGTLIKKRRFRNRDYNISYHQSQSQPHDHEPIDDGGNTDSRIV